MLRAILDWLVGGEMQSVESFEKCAMVAYEMPQREDLHIICQDILIARV
jgi:hypothetical protein